MRGHDGILLNVSRPALVNDSGSSVESASMRASHTAMAIFVLALARLKLRAFMGKLECQ
jgi:hypothetical protein